MRSPTRTAVALALLGLGLLTGAATAGSVAPPPGPLDLVPDLRGLAAADLSIAVAPGGRRLLRLTTEVANTGRGPLELRPAVGDCDGDGNPSNDRLAYQRVFQDANGDGVFERSVDRGFRDLPAGCMRFHSTHDHWHFRGFASYLLVNAHTGRVVSEADKVSFCAIDIDPRWPRLPGFTNVPVYDECGATRPQGLSVGWGDIYGAGLPGQTLDISHVGRGRYCLVTIADPQGRVLEVDEGNNATGTGIVIQRGGRVRSEHRPCPPAPSPAPA
jgi:Lysyl oxidase